MTTVVRMVIAFVFLTLYSGQTFACSCGGGGPVEEFYDKYDHIFVARVVGADLAEDADTGDQKVLARFETVELFRGNPDAVTISADTMGPGISTCTVWLHIGSYYLIFATENEPVHLQLCHPSGRPVDYGKDGVSKSVQDMRRLIPENTP